MNWTLRTPLDFDTASRHVRPKDMRDSVLVSADLQRHAAWLSDFAELGFGELQLHHVGTGQQAFIEAFGQQVLPSLAGGGVPDPGHAGAERPASREIYRSPNGDRWLLLETGPGEPVVRHEANAAAGGRRTDVPLGEFLSRASGGPEHQELEKLVAAGIVRP